MRRRPRPTRGPSHHEGGGEIIILGTNESSVIKSSHNSHPKLSGSMAVKK